jgi:hypothetical protein
MSEPPERLADAPPSGDPVRDRIGQLMRNLRAPPRFDAAASARLQRAVGKLAADPAPRRSRWLTFAIPAAAALAVVAVVRPLVRTDDHSGIRARGPAHAAVALVGRPPELLIFRVGPGGHSEPLGGTVHRSDELAFGYRSEGTAERRLLVFARDSSGQIYWYHPAWTDPADNPEAVAILPEAGVHELPAAVVQPLPEGTVEICSLFTARPWRVREAEAAIARGDLRPDCRKVTVIP